MRSQKLITERQNREKTLPRRRKKEKKIKNILKAIEAEDNTDEVDSQNEEEEDKEHFNEMLASVDAETKEAVMVGFQSFIQSFILCYNCLSHSNVHFAA